MKQAVHLILVSLFLEKEGQILLMERQLLQGGGFTLPGGHVDANETAYKALKREVFEETGIKIKRKNLRLIHVMQPKNA
ncbi:MAG: NUDIX hydrolase [Sphingobacteriales bacterium]|nr:NUDIX hydrolase [Sphingobacteriales bacterium]